MDMMQQYQKNQRLKILLSINSSIAFVCVAFGLVIVLALLRLFGFITMIETECWQSFALVFVCLMLIAFLIVRRVNVTRGIDFDTKTAVLISVMSLTAVVCGPIMFFESAPIAIYALVSILVVCNILLYVMQLSIMLKTKIIVSVLCVVGAIILICCACYNLTYEVRYCNFSRIKAFTYTDSNSDKVDYSDRMVLDKDRYDDFLKKMTEFYSYSATPVQSKEELRSMVNNCGFYEEERAVIESLLFSEEYFKEDFFDKYNLYFCVINLDDLEDRINIDDITLAYKYLSMDYSYYKNKMGDNVNDAFSVAAIKVEKNHYSNLLGTAPFTDNNGEVIMGSKNVIYN
ncbi:MAG: hypothetical protein U0L20_03920 [Ruminococcus sp.]|nr:hypothetical protein [Ruminococcus sp.]